jgi:hypothetical protein
MPRSWAGFAARIVRRISVTQTLMCHHCGLVLTIGQAKGGTRLSYDPAEWGRFCKHPALDSPVLCLLQGGGSKG